MDILERGQTHAGPTEYPHYNLHSCKLSHKSQNTAKEPNVSSIYRTAANGCTTVSTSRCRLFPIESKQTNLYSSHGNTRFVATHKASSILTVTNPSQRQTEI